LTLREDSKGLYFEAELPDTTAAEDLSKLIRRRDITGMSFSFSINGAGGEHWRDRKNGVPERDLIDLDLYEVTVTPVPAYATTSVQLSRATPKSANALVKERMRQKLKLREKLAQ
jgi:HK97 family phage prohead protease